MPIAKEFQVHRLNAAGLAHAEKLAQAFTDLMIALDLPEGREKSLVITNLQTAAFWAKRAIAQRPEYQET